MREIVDTGLPLTSAPIEWATKAGGALYTSHIPILENGEIEQGDISTQTHVIMRNLLTSVEAAGGSMEDVTQVLIYLTNPDDFTAFNDVYQSYFSPPYPNRATVVVAGFLAPHMVIEIVAYAYIDEK